nr:MAG TPA: hypothetical protein [Caudoviricetes sp.]
MVYTGSCSHPAILCGNIRDEIFALRNNGRCQYGYHSTWPQPEQGRKNLVSDGTISCHQQVSDGVIRLVVDFCHLNLGICRNVPGFRYQHLAEFDEIAVPILENAVFFRLDKWLVIGIGSIFRDAAETDHFGGRRLRGFRGVRRFQPQLDSPLLEILGQAAGLPEGIHPQGDDAHNGLGIQDGGRHVNVRQERLYLVDIVVQAAVGVVTRDVQGGLYFIQQLRLSHCHACRRPFSLSGRFLDKDHQAALVNHLTVHGHDRLGALVFGVPVFFTLDTQVIDGIQNVVGQGEDGRKLGVCGNGRRIVGNILGDDHLTAQQEALRLAADTVVHTGNRLAICVRDADKGHKGFLGHQPLGILLVLGRDSSLGLAQCGIVQSPSFRHFDGLACVGGLRQDALGLAGAGAVDDGRFNGAHHGIGNVGSQPVLKCGQGHGGDFHGNGNLTAQLEVCKGDLCAGNLLGGAALALAAAAVGFAGPGCSGLGHVGRHFHPCRVAGAGNQAQDGANLVHALHDPVDQGGGDHGRNVGGQSSGTQLRGNGGAPHNIVHKRLPVLHRIGGVCALAVGLAILGSLAELAQVAHRVGAAALVDGVGAAALAAVAVIAALAVIVGQVFQLLLGVVQLVQDGLQGIAQASHLVGGAGLLDQLAQLSSTLLLGGNQSVQKISHGVFSFRVMSKVVKIFRLELFQFQLGGVHLATLLPGGVHRLPGAVQRLLASCADFGLLIGGERHGGDFHHRADFPNVSGGMVAFKVFPLFVVNAEHKGHAADVSPLHSGVKAAGVGVVFSVQGHPDSHAVIVHGQLHGAVFVVLPASGKGNLAGVVVHKETHVLQVGLVQGAPFDDFIEPAQVCHFVIDDWPPGDNVTALVVLVGPYLESVGPPLQLVILHSQYLHCPGFPCRSGILRPCLHQSSSGTDTACPPAPAAGAYQRPPASRSRTWHRLGPAG